MKQAPILFAASIVACITLVSRSGGPATAAGLNATGELGPSITCAQAYCHGSASSDITVSVDVLDPETSTSADQYIPGQDYLLRVTVNGGSAGESFGFQSAVVASDGSNAGALSSPSSNAHLASVASTGRNVVEHNAPSSDNVFEATWTAPAVGAGDAIIYTSALAVNGDGGTGGDRIGTATTILPEATTENVAIDHQSHWATPIRSGDMWNWTAPTAGRLVVADAAGRVLQARELSRDEPLTWTCQGIQLVHFVSQQGQRQSWKIATP